MTDARTSRPRTIRLEIEVASDEEVAALRGALLAARAGELAELHRRGGRLVHGYGTESAREGMQREVARSRLRWTMLDRLLAALEAENGAAVTGHEEDGDRVK